MNFKSKNTIKWLGPNLEKGKRNYENEEKRAKDEFKKKYPYADISKFDFWVSINQKGEISSPTEIVYTSGKDTKLYNETGTLWKYSWNINSQTFKDMYQSNLYWGPENGIFQPTEKLVPFRAEGAKLGFDLTKFPIYVTESKSFTSNFENLETEWDESANDITKANLDYIGNKYFTSLCASYIIFSTTGICQKHFKTNKEVSPIITNIMRYFVYYHMKRFLTVPNLMKPFLTSDSIKTIQRNIPIKKIWTKKYKTTKESMSYFLASKKKEKKEVKGAKYYGGGYGRVIGIEYEEVTGITNQGDNDWQKFLRSETFGVTKRG